MTENMEQYDVLVIGGGPGGYSLGIAAAKKGLKVALFEKEHLGGTCLNVGCIPTKYLVDKANAMEKVRALVKKDIFRDAGSFSFKKIQQGKGEVTAKLVGGVKYLLKKAGADVITGEATLKADRVVSCGGKDYQGKYVVIATGSVPMMIPVPGYELCIDSTGALNLPSLPRSMVVMGGGVIGLELACAFAAYGTEITVVEMMPELMPREQKEAVRIVVNAMKKQGIALKTGAKMLRIEKNGGLLRAVYEIEGKEEYTDCEQVLMAAAPRRISPASTPRRSVSSSIGRSASSSTSISTRACRASMPSATLWAAISWRTRPMPRERPRWPTCSVRTSPTARSPCPSAPIRSRALPPSA